MVTTVDTLEELEAEAKRFVDSLVPSGGATLVTLSGELGAGKTAFTKACARALGIEDTVNSPTFVLEKIYKLGHPTHFERLVHIDAYRLETGGDLTPLCFDELMKDRGNFIFLEWPEKVADALPPPAHAITLTLLSDGSRTISYD